MKQLCAWPIRKWIVFVISCAGLLVPATLYAQVRDVPRAGAANAAFFTVVPDHVLDVVLGRATDQGVTVTALSRMDQSATLDWSDATGGREERISVQLSAGEPRAVELADLAPDREYRYGIRGAAGGDRKSTRLNSSH